MHNTVRPETIWKEKRKITDITPNTANSAILLNSRYAGQTWRGGKMGRSKQVLFAWARTDRPKTLFLHF